MAKSEIHTVKKRLSSITLWLGVVACLAIAERLLVVFLYGPVSYSDTPSYRRLAQAVLRGFVHYDGTRTPGYPVFLAMTGNDQVAWLAQLFLGLVTTVLLFYIGWKLTGKPWFGGVIALAHTFNLGQLFFESNLLTESLTTFFLVITMAGILAWLLYPRIRKLWFAFLLGIVSTITLLIRPLFIYLPFFLILIILLEPKLNKYAIQRVNQSSNEDENLSRYHPWRLAIAALLPVLLLLGSWVAFIHNEYGEWSLTTMTGYHLVQHTGSYFEYVPDEDAKLRDTYIKYRDAHIAQFGTQTNAIWDAIPEMTKVSGYSFYALSRKLASISVQLILHHPLLFIKNAISGWWMFWRAPVYWSAEALKLPILTNGINLSILLERGMLFIINLAFIGASLYFAFIEVVSAVRHRPLQFSFMFTNPTQYIFLWISSVNIWIASILQTLLDHGDNPRFLVPMQSLVVLWVAVFIFHMMTSRRSPSAHTLQVNSMPPHSGE